MVHLHNASLQLPIYMQKGDKICSFPYFVGKSYGEICKKDKSVNAESHTLLKMFPSVTLSMTIFLKNADSNL